MKYGIYIVHFISHIMLFLWCIECIVQGTHNTSIWEVVAYSTSICISLYYKHSAAAAQYTFDYVQTNRYTYTYIHGGSTKEWWKKM